MKQILLGSSNHNIFLVIFVGKAFKLEKAGPTFSSFNPSPSLSSVTTDEKKQFLCLDIVLHNTTSLLFLELK